METVKVCVRKVHFGPDGYVYDARTKEKLLPDYSGKVVADSATKVFFLKNGLLHRENKPAIIYPRFTAYWYEGKLHRDDGWAIEWSNGTKEYYIHGQKLDLEQFLERQKNTQWWPQIMAAQLGHK